MGTERMTSERLRMLATGGMTQTVFFEAVRARASEDEKDAEIARLRAALHRQERDYLNADSERRALRDAVNAYQPEILALRAALRPFAGLAKAMGDRLSPEEMKLDTLAKIHDVPGVTLGDCRAALKALGEET